MNGTRCASPNCIEPPITRGLCNRCYQRKRRKDGLQQELPLGRHSLTEIDKVARTARCAVCGQVPIRYRPPGAGGSECMTSRRANRGKKKTTPAARRRQWLRQYDITPDEYEGMVAAQSGRCAICAATRALVVDHSHETGTVRGLLCSTCNAGLGMLGDDVRGLLAAIAYLENAVR